MLYFSLLYIFFLISSMDLTLTWIWTSLLVLTHVALRTALRKGHCNYSTLVSKLKQRKSYHSAKTTQPAGGMKGSTVLLLRFHSFHGRTDEDPKFKC